MCTWGRLWLVWPFCRNPDKRSQPWCWVRGQTRKFTQPCHIPQCEKSDTGKTFICICCCFFSQLYSLSTLLVSAMFILSERTCGERVAEQNFKIVGGSRAPIESQPWLASIFRDKVYSCAGTLIAPCWVLSAAHCFPQGYVMHLTLMNNISNCLTEWNAMISLLFHCLF